MFSVFFHKFPDVFHRMARFFHITDAKRGGSVSGGIFHMIGCCIRNSLHEHFNCHILRHGNLKKRIYCFCRNQTFIDPGTSGNRIHGSAIGSDHIFHSRKCHHFHGNSLQGTPGGRNKIYPCFSGLLQCLTCFL